MALTLLKAVSMLSLWLFAGIYGAWAFCAVIVVGFRVGFRKLFSWEVTERPACLDDKTIGIHGYLHLEDVRIHYVASGPEDKPLMLFMHGFPELWFSWRHQIKEFQRDYRVVAFDMRGYNESDKPKGLSAYSLDKLMADVKQVILALGYKSCILVTHDWGGVIAWPFARLYPDYVEKLIVINAPPGPIMAKLIETDSKQWRMSWYLFLFQLPLFPELLLKLQNFRVIEAELEKTGISQEEINVFKHAFSQPGALTPPINYYRSLLRGTSEAVKHDLDYTMPVLLIWGCQDKFLSSDIPDLVQNQNPKISVRRIENATHFVQNHYPEAVNEIMREWLTQ